MLPTKFDIEIKNDGMIDGNGPLFHIHTIRTDKNGPASVCQNIVFDKCCRSVMLMLRNVVGICKHCDVHTWQDILT